MSSCRILVVEDRDSLRRMLDRALSGEGYVVETAASGEAGLEPNRQHEDRAIGVGLDTEQPEQKAKKSPVMQRVTNLLDVFENSAGQRRPG